MKTTTEFAYDSWCRNNGVKPLTCMEKAMGNQKHIERFIRLMREHTVQGWFRYGSMQSYRDNPPDFVQIIQKTLFLYETSGNIEHLIDIANWAGMCFLYAKHPLRHYEPHEKKR
jgi:hypothetical protein